MKTFQNKKIWITGATSGIGEQLAYTLNNAGSFLIISSRRKDELERVKMACKYPDKVSIQELDMEKPESFTDIVMSVSKKHDRIDYLFNNAGISQRSLVRDTLPEVERKIIEVNYFGNILLSKALLPIFEKQNYGHIVVTSSVAGKYGFYQRSAYAASKHALHGYYESLRYETSENNIKITLLVLGSINTGMSENALKGDGQRYNIKDPMLVNGLSLEKCVSKILDGVANEKREAHIGGTDIFAITLKRFFPRLFYWMMKRKIKHLE
ncbi:MAG: SDR family NAD(P)-dependent oxidoreductase [Cyclobacteriaceae bacterium]|nr:SDR family NAD(P)-dependent oxidoreductase [Cyclobacteriaceae bacterium]